MNRACNDGAEYELHWWLTSTQPISVYFAVDVLLQDGSKAAVAAGNARNKMDGINSEATSSSSLVILYLLAIKGPFFDSVNLYSFFLAWQDQTSGLNHIKKFNQKRRCDILTFKTKKSFHVENLDQLEIGLRFWVAGHLIASFAFSDFAI